MVKVKRQQKAANRQVRPKKAAASSVKLVPIKVKKHPVAKIAKRALKREASTQVKVEMPKQAVVDKPKPVAKQKPVKERGLKDVAESHIKDKEDIQGIPAEGEIIIEDEKPSPIPKEVEEIGEETEEDDVAAPEPKNSKLFNEKDVDNEKIAVLEAALFMSSKPLALDELAQVAGVNSLGYVKSLLERLQKNWAGKGVEILHGSEGWQMAVKHDILPKVAHLTPYFDISEGCKRTLALVVYKEPAKQSEIVRMQGNKAYTYIKDLIKKGLISAKREGRTKVLSLTQDFERYFGEEREKIKEQIEQAICKKES